MKKLIVTAAVVCLSVATVVAAVYQGGPARNAKFPGIEIAMRLERDGSGNRYWRISEKAPIFAIRFADVNIAHDLINEAESREMAKSVAVTIAKYLGSTNPVRIVHREVPAAAGTNYMDHVQAWLKGREVIDEVVPLTD